MKQTVEIIQPKPKYKDIFTNQVIRKKRVAAYARVSTDETDQLNSYQAQIEEFTRRINANLEWEFAGMFCDEGITGTNMLKRPGFMKMIDAAKSGHIDLILTKSISRFSRNTVDILTTIKELRSVGVEIFFEKENITSVDPKIDFVLTIMSSMAQEESRSISENTKWGIQKRFQQGKLIMCTRNFLGYDMNELGDLIINPEQADTVRYIFKCYINDGYATKYYIKNAHEAIIDREVYDIVQTMMHARHLIVSVDSKERFKHLAQKPMKGLVYCSQCKRMFNSKMHNSGTTFKKSMLKCHTSRNNPMECDNHSIHEPLLERATLHVVETMTKTKDMQDSILFYMEQTLKKNNSHEQLQNLKLDRIDLGNKLKAHVNNRIHSSLSDSDYKKEYRRLEIEYNSITKHIEALTQDITKEHLMRRRFYALKSFIDTNYQDTSIIKSFFGIVLMMGQNHVRYVIDDTFITIDELHEQMNTLKELPILMKGTYYDLDTRENIYYEVVIYERN